MSSTPIFPTQLHTSTAEMVREYFVGIPKVDTILVVNSCARGQATPESDLDFAILVKPETSISEINNIESDWINYLIEQPTYLEYKRSSEFAHLHLDIINGKYTSAKIEAGEPVDSFELEIGNQISYSAPMNNAGQYFLELQNKWLPYYSEELRLQRLAMIKDACIYDLNHCHIFVKRHLYFQAFDILYKAFQKFLQLLFIACKTYPIAYNKWIKYQFEEKLNKPDLYPRLSPVLSIKNIESNEINNKVEMLRELLNELPGN
ncbi:nucleotidyltransferase domain-containing protein [Panacibacter ginsenosidivorans]|uniref:Nucleotidyltransferase domain-containing protein n=1 Tax=Panacibacter ginsenosidivorans TaxID=1813871 RepID=A0A5B8V690_9BACT|nr:nucleotidyltransferase domain-containing protein [Panacibacter ginsenosidivorans]QEC66762.1 nucleotidyltransferase domain-containing protein [Panacibacter ginsenosidivorans]